MSSINGCPRCGAKLSSDDAQGLCPRCLLKAARESDTSVESGDPAAERAIGPSGFSPAGDAPTVDYPPRGGSAGELQRREKLPQPGERIGNYYLIRQLGRGGMGAVFEADDLESGRRVALKLLAHSLDSPEARNRFFREGRLAASINHPNSVYVYGTEEIDGTPAISMEQVLGGTLQDRVRQQGPLPVTKAVDAILQIIDGLEAAAAAGVLHRDVKPSNCFVDADGTVKVGDFGLSISTTVRGDSHLTSPGSFLGTPAFSSPEQLRGDELDVRSDIYAVGVTLYYLLTGRTPFEAENVVKLLATVLEQPAPSPARYRQEIPLGLAHNILRCLAKQPAERFRNYAELRAALLPYNSTAPTPATLALRCAAGICDFFIWTLAVLMIQIAWFQDFAAMTDLRLFQSPGYIAAMIVAMCLHVVYFAVPEGLWGASPGKLICRLRVVDRRRSRIGVPRAALRTIIFVTFPSLIVWSYWIVGGKFPFGLDSGVNWLAVIISYSYYLMLALLFSTARRRNGYAGLHDLAVGARVIMRSAYQSRPSLSVPAETLPDAELKPTIGPYHVLDSIEQNAMRQFVLGYDTRLLRRVWIQRLPAGSPPLPGAQRSVSRVGRLRWINGCRDGGQCWDAYEALSGRPLLGLLDQPQPWNAVRYWLLDLAQELNAASKDGTVPEVLGLKRVWITAEGRAKLLDFPAPGIPPIDDAAVETAAEAPASAAGRFLLQVARAALQAGAEEHTDDIQPPRLPLPLEARDLLGRIAQAENLHDICHQLARLVKKTPAVTRSRRLAMLAATAGVPILIAVFSVVSVSLLNQGNAQQPQIHELRNCLMYLDWGLKRTAARAAPSQSPATIEAQREALEIYLAGRFRQTITDEKTWNSLIARTIPMPHRAMAERIVAQRPAPSAAELERATSIVKPMLEEFGEVADVTSKIPLLAMGLIQFESLWCLLVAMPGLLAAAVFRRGLIMRSFRVDCATRNGAPASRWRMLWRTIVFNAPVLSGPFVLALVFPLVGQLTPVLGAMVAVLLALAAGSLALPQRGLADRLSGNYPVPG